MKAVAVFCLCVSASLAVRAAPGTIILFNGTSSAGKSSLADVMIRESEQKYEVLSYDDFLRSYRQERGITWLNPEQYRDFLLSLYRHARNRSDAGTNVIIDTVEFDLAYEKYCELLNCSNVIKTIVYCPLEPLLKRIDRRNSAYLFSG